ncbi:MAG: HAD family hydrolase [Bdellovibrionales bacterium]|nr:HAD family hydrolase [Bdellovibrionales bacterium]
MPLNEILEKAQHLKQTNQSLLAIFDLDSTIFDVSPRTQKILEDFKNDPTIQKKYPSQVEQMKDLAVKNTDWGIKESFSRAQILGTVDFFDEARKYWALHFFSNHYLIYDKPYDGAVDFLNKLSSFGAKIVYLTGRDVKRMGEGTKKSLLDHGLPLKHDNDLILKPFKGMSDSLFKKEVIDELKNDHEEIWFFENEPVNTKIVEEHHQDVRIVFFDSVHSGREKTPTHHMTIQHFLLHKS